MPDRFRVFRGAAGADARATLSIMSRAGASRLLVLDGEHLAEVVTLNDLLKWNPEGVA